jgi:hypothetical protein
VFHEGFLLARLITNLAQKLLFYFFNGRPNRESWAIAYYTYSPSRRDEESISARPVALSSSCFVSRHIEGFLRTNDLLEGSTNLIEREIVLWSEGKGN